MLRCKVRNFKKLQKNPQVLYFYEFENMFSYIVHVNFTADDDLHSEVYCKKYADGHLFEFA